MYKSANLTEKIDYGLILTGLWRVSDDHGDKEHQEGKHNGPLWECDEGCEALIVSVNVWSRYGGVGEGIVGIREGDGVAVCVVHLLAEDLIAHAVTGVV